MINNNLENSIRITNGLIDQHIHGGYGVNLNNTDEDGVIYLASMLFKHGICYFFPTLMTDQVENIQKQIRIIKNAQKKIGKEKISQIIGIHLEGPFINPEKRGIHPKEFIISPSVERYKLFEDKIIKIITIAPELDTDNRLTEYLKSKGVKINVGHSISREIKDSDCITHIFNAMPSIHHRNKSLALTGLLDKEIYTEVIGDCNHLSIEMLKLIFKVKDKKKIILISDALNGAYIKSNSFEFASEEIFIEDGKAVDKNRIMAGSIVFLDDIIRKLASLKIISFENLIRMASKNLEIYHKIKNNYRVYWDKNFNIIEIKNKFS